eukprot:3670474-Rhodomonas_salina.1
MQAPDTADTMCGTAYVSTGHRLANTLRTVAASPMSVSDHLAIASTLVFVSTGHRLALSRRT